MQLYFCPNSFRTYFQNCFVFSCFKVKVTRRKLITYASINVKPEGGGGGGAVGICGAFDLYCLPHPREFH